MRWGRKPESPPKDVETFISSFDPEAPGLGSHLRNMLEGYGIETLYRAIIARLEGQAAQDPYDFVDDDEAFGRLYSLIAFLLQRAGFVPGTSGLALKAALLERGDLARILLE